MAQLSAVPPAFLLGLAKPRDLDLQLMRLSQERQS